MSDREDKVAREVIAHKLIAGTATQEERDNALATILLSLWTFKDLRDAFNTWHTDKCEQCPARKHVEEVQKEESGGVIGFSKKHFGIILWIITVLVAIIAKMVNVQPPTM